MHNLSVENCLDPHSDAARGTFRAQEVRRSFAFGFRKLEDAVREGKVNILSTIIRV